MEPVHDTGLLPIILLHLAFLLLSYSSSTTSSCIHCDMTLRSSIQDGNSTPTPALQGSQLCLHSQEIKSLSSARLCCHMQRELQGQSTWKTVHVKLWIWNLPTGRIFLESFLSHPTSTPEPLKALPSQCKLWHKRPPSVGPVFPAKSKHFLAASSWVKCPRLSVWNWLCFPFSQTQNPVQFHRASPPSPPPSPPLILWGLRYKTATLPPLQPFRAHNCAYRVRKLRKNQIKSHSTHTSGPGKPQALFCPRQHP